MVIGGGDVSLLPDNTIKDVLWEYYFDVEKTIQWAVGSLKFALLLDIISRSIRGAAKATDSKGSQR